MYFKWTDDLNTGLAEIDEQHRRIVDYINALYHARESGDRSEVGVVLENLVDYTVNHFLFEENLMERAGYEFLSSHEKVHEIFGRKVADYRQRFANGEDVADDVLSMLKNWLGNHIKEEDRGYISAVRPLVTSTEEKGWVSGLMKKLFG